MRPPILDYVASHTTKDGKPFATFERGIYNLNIIGLRTPEPKDAGTFNDRCLVVYKDEREIWQCASYAITTDPGVYYRTRPINVHGTAIMCEGQYRGAYKLGRHRGSPGLVQTGGRVSFWRDSNKDQILDMDPATVADGYIGLNLHKSSASRDGQGGDREGAEVGRWSAGCQVWADADEFDHFLSLCRAQLEHHPTWAPRFTYTLLTAPAW